MLNKIVIGEFCTYKQVKDRDIVAELVINRIQT